MSKKSISVLIVLVLGALGLGGWYFFYSQGVPGYWGLVKGESSFHFSTVKNGDIEETHTIENLDGYANFNGDYVVRLDLSSLETGIDIRNERMRDFLFETAQYPVARIEGKFVFTDVAEIAIGGSGVYQIPAKVKLHGVERDMILSVSIDRPEWDRVIVTPTDDILVEAADFNLVAGIETLRGLAGLDSISTTVPVTFRLVFEATSDDGNFRIQSR